MNRGIVRVDVVREGADLVVRLAGELDAATWERPVEALESALPDAGPARVVVDLGGVTFFDSSGLGCLVRIRNTCHAAGIPLALRRVRPTVQRLLATTGLQATFPLADGAGG